jgi:DNA-binding HxlR family transcriptional regulator/putative sterol carrier protein
VIRELIFGQKRYTDLLNGLPGIGANVLATRLKDLQSAGLVRQTTLPPPAASTVYELTEVGAALEPVVVALAKWGMHLMDSPHEGDRPQLGWYLGLMQAYFNPDAARGVKETYELRIDGDVFHARVDDGTVQVRQGPAAQPDFAFSSDLMTFVLVGSGQLPFRDAVAQGKVTVEGDPDAGRRMGAIFGRRVTEPLQAVTA